MNLQILICHNFDIVTYNFDLLAHQTQGIIKTTPETKYFAQPWSRLVGSI